MSPRWEDVNARSRGLGGHLLSRGALESLARLPDLAALEGALERSGIPLEAAAAPRDPAELELGVRRWAAAALRTLARWTGARSAALPLVFDAEDRRSLRAIFRGAVQRAPAVARLGGLIPTPALPERALHALASAPTIAAASALLSAWGHPYAPALATAASAAEPDLFRLECALARAAMARATAAARRSGSAALRDLVRDSIDLENAATALVLAVAGRDLRPADQFLPGGARLSMEAFAVAIQTRSATTASATLSNAFAATPWMEAFAAAGGDAALFEQAAVRIRLRDLVRQVRLSPLDPLTTVWFGLRLRAQAIDLQRVIWTVALDAPRAAAAARFLTVAA